MANEASVTRTYRMAIRCGEDFITIEETVTLPVGASDDEIAAAVETGLRIYQLQQQALDQQATLIREQAGPSTPRIMDPDAPASEKQRSYLDYLTTTLEWPTDRLGEFLRERGAAYDTLTKGQASAVIDELKTQLDGRRDAPAPAAAIAAAPAAREDDLGDPASEKQIRALENLAREHGIDLGAELRSRYGLRAIEELAAGQAAQLLRELQPQRRARSEATVMQERRR
jgi:hypothetical protein